MKEPNLTDPGIQNSEMDDPLENPSGGKQAMITAMLIFLCIAGKTPNCFLGLENENKYMYSIVFWATKLETIP